jgi:hypothetical protein
MAPPSPAGDPVSATRPWPAGASCQPLAADAALATVQRGVIGTWRGQVVRAGPIPRAMYPVELTLGCDGHYSGHCLVATWNLGPGTGDVPCTLLDYADDGDHPEKTYGIDGVRSDGDALGHLVAYFYPQDVVVDRLAAISLSPDGRRLSFEVWHLDFDMPFTTFDLERVAP